MAVEKITAYLAYCESCNTNLEINSDETTADDILREHIDEYHD